MADLEEFILLLLSQFSGGPRAPENNLVRFGLAAIFWGVLLIVAWSRQRQERLPREKLLLYGFGLGLCRELMMEAHASLRMLSPSNYQLACMVMEPIEHAMMLATVVVISGAFLRYILDDALLTKRFLRIGLAIAAVEYLVTLIWWPSQLANDTDLRFHQSWSALLMHVIACIVIIVAIVILVRKRGWLRNVVVLALSMFLVSEFLTVLNLSTASTYKDVLCPVSNTFYIWAIPLFGYVYFREQSLEKRRAEEALNAYRQHLEEMVAARTSELMEANKQLERAAVLEERQRIAAEMHDGLAQTLAYLGIKTDEASTLLQGGQSDQLVGEFNQMRRAIDQASVDVRRAIANLANMTHPRLSLQDVLSDLVKQKSEERGVAIRLVDKLVAPLLLRPDELEQAVRVTAEALLNAVHHAHAQDIYVQVEAQEDGIRLLVADDGQGFDQGAGAPQKTDHFGLGIMRARAARLGGQLTIRSAPGQGTRVALTWNPKLHSRSDEREKREVSDGLPPLAWLPSG